MAWNKNLPLDTTKLRISAGIIRQNWNGIENGEVPHVKLQLAMQGANPTRLANTGWLFSKQDASATELYYEDDRNPALVTQLTSVGRVGGATTGIVGQYITFDSTWANDQRSMITAWACVNISGSSISSQVGYNISVSRTSTGKYLCTILGTAVTNANYIVMGCANTSSGGSEATSFNIAADEVKDATSFTIRMKHTTSDSNVDRSFYVAVCGGR